MELRPFKTDALWENLRLSIEQAPFADQDVTQLLELTICAERAFDAGSIGSDTLRGSLSDIARTAETNLPAGFGSPQELSDPAQEACQRALLDIFQAVYLLSECLCLTLAVPLFVQRNRRCETQGPNTGRCVEEPRHICIEKKIGDRFSCISLRPLTKPGIDASL